MENNNSITIDLSRSMNSRSFENEEIIHKAEFERITELINNKINNIDADSSKFSIRNRYNDTITILGPRGSGKTSFVMSVLKEYENDNNIELIELIDPTLIEEKGHIFLTVISLIKDKVENKLRNNECDPLCTEYQQRKCWNNKLKKLAAGLPSIDIDNESLYANWQDPEYVMNKGLAAVKSAKELECNFNEIVNKALCILNKKAFLIAFDDIDINFNNGWKVLETIRKYLTSPQIITLLSGDIKLFSKAIRKQQWENFGTKLLTWEGEKLNRLEEFDEMVTEIESQYMQKIMKSPNRIHLSTINELLSRGIKIYINNQKDINECYINLLKDLGIQNENEAHSVVSYLLNLPLRTQIQILKLYEEHKKVNLIGITDNFVSDMYELGIDVEHAKLQPRDFCYITHKFLLKNEILNETYQLLPTSGHVNYNSALFSLFTMFSTYSKNNPSMIFEYWISIATIKNLLTIIPYKSELKKDNALVPTIEGLSDYSFIGQNKVYRDICSYLSTYIRATLNSKGSENKLPWGGTLILKGFKEQGNSRINCMYISDRLILKKPRENVMQNTDKIYDKNECIFDSMVGIQRQITFLPMSVALLSHKQQSMIIYSFYSLLGGIVELLKHYNIVKNNEIKKNRAIYALLNELSQVKDYVMPTFEKTGESSEQDPIYTNSIEENIVPDIKNDLDFIKEICKWMDNSPKCVPAHLIGKIATRVFYAMRNLDDMTIKDENPNLGDAMHRRIMIVMNSAIVEDAKENLPYYNLNNNNPSENDQIFINNLKKLNNLNLKKYSGLQRIIMLDYLIFSKWLLSCPLLLLYLNPYNNDTDNQMWTELSSFINVKKNTNQIDNKFITLIKKNSIYEKLQNILIYSNNESINEKKMAYTKINNQNTD